MKLTKIIIIHITKCLQCCLSGEELALHWSRFPHKPVQWRLVSLQLTRFVITTLLICRFLSLSSLFANVAWYSSMKYYCSSTCWFVSSSETYKKCSNIGNYSMNKFNEPSFNCSGREQGLMREKHCFFLLLVSLNVNLINAFDQGNNRSIYGEHQRLIDDNKMRSSRVQRPTMFV